MVPLRVGPHRRFRRRAGRRVAHRLYRRARLRDLLPSEGCARRVRRGVGGGRRSTASRRSGLEALDMLRIEAGLIFADYEFTDQTDPFEAGIGFTVPLKTKTDDFIGKAALDRAQGASAPPAGRARDRRQRGGGPWRLRAYRAARRSARSRAARARRSSRRTSRWRAIDVAHAAIGTEVEIGKLDGHQKRLPAPHRALPASTIPRRRGCVVSQSADRQLSERPSLRGRSPYAR